MEGQNLEARRTEIAEDTLRNVRDIFLNMGDETFFRDAQCTKANTSDAGRGKKENAEQNPGEDYYE